MSIEVCVTFSQQSICFAFNPKACTAYFSKTPKNTSTQCHKSIEPTTFYTVNKLYP